MLVVMGIWLVLTVLYGYATVSAKMALPPSPELYTNSVAFQTFGFVAGKLPPLVVVLFVILGFQVLFLHAETEFVTPSGMRLLRRTLLVGVAIMLAALLRFMLVADVPYNPWFQYDEQLVLRFALVRLPIYALLTGLVLAGELRWLKLRAS